MPDAADKVLSILIKFGLSDEAAKKATAEIETLTAETTAAAGATKEMTAATGGLATALPDLTTKTEAFVIATESEYRAVFKTAEALRTRIAVRQAAGLSVAEETRRLAALDAALSSETALRVAETMETRAAAAAKLEDAAAADINTAAMDRQAFAGRKMVSLFDEMSRGQRGAMVATFGSLLKETGAGLGVLAGTIALFAAGNALWNYFRKADEEAKKLHEDMIKLSAQIWLEQEQTSEVADTAAQDYFDSLNKITNGLKNVEAADSDELKILNARVAAQKDLLQLSEKLELAALKRQKLPSEQEAIAEDAIRRRYGDMTTAADLAQEQRAIDLKRSAYAKAVQTEPDLYFKSVEAENAAKAVAKAKGVPTNAEISDAEKRYQDALKASGKTQPELDAALPRERQAMEQTKKALNDWLTKMGPNANLPEFAGMRSSLQSAAKSAQQAYELDNAVTLAQQHFLDLSKKLKEHEDQLKALNKAADAAKDAYQKNEEAIQKYNEAIKTDTEVHRIHEGTSKTEAAGKAASGATTTAEEIARFIEGGGKPSSQQAAFLQNWASEVAGQQVSLNTAIQMAEAGARNTNAFMTQVQRLAASLTSLDFSQIQHLADIVTELQQKMRTLQMQLDTTQSR